MSPDRHPDEPPSARREPVGQPVVRGDETVTGRRARDAVQFDPDDPESIELAAQTVRKFAAGDHEGNDHIFMLRGAAACAALVLGEGSYKSARERAGDPVTVSFIRKWARVHDLPQSIRRHVARGHIAPTAAKHIARVPGEARFYLAWAALDHDLTVRDIRQIATEVNDGTPAEQVLMNYGVTPGELTVQLPTDIYRDLRRSAAYVGTEPSQIITELLMDHFERNEEFVRPQPIDQQLRSE